MENGVIEFYLFNAAYTIIKLVPKMLKLTTCQTSPRRFACATKNTKATMLKKKPAACETMLIFSSIGE
jgi:hypothetical protein